MTTVRATRFVDCPFSAVIEYSEQALHGRSSVSLSPAAPVSHRVDVTTRSAEDMTDDVRRHDALLVAWRPALPAFFPQFHGALTVRPKGRGAWLRIHGSYEPPFGVAGRIFDALVGRTIAKRTLAHFLADVASSAERRWHAVKDSASFDTSG